MSKKYTYSEVGNARVCDNTGAIVAVKLGGVWFNLIGTSEEPVIMGDSYANDDTQIYKVYARPSDAKVGIWTSWTQWARENNARVMISSYSATFSVSLALLLIRTAQSTICILPMRTSIAK